MNRFIIVIFLFFMFYENLSAQIYPQAQPQMQPDYKFCQNCDTLLLEEEKPCIIFYEIFPVWNNTYNHSIKGYDNPIRKGSLMEREWKELATNYPDIKKLYINNHCQVEVPNFKWETFNFLCQACSFTGFFYWSGNFPDPCIKSDKFSGLTELVSDTRNEKKTSSYINEYPFDSLAFVQMQNSLSPSQKVRDNLRYLPLPGNDLLEYFPHQFIHLDNVRKICIGDETFQKTRVEIDFNKDQTINKAELYKDNKLVARKTLTFTYTDGLLKTVDDGTVRHYFYKEDTVFTMTQHRDVAYVSKYVLKENTFLLHLKYCVGENTSKTMDIEKKLYHATDLNGVSCLRSADETISYSNLYWKFPLTISEDQLRRGQYNTEIEMNFSTKYRKNGENICVDYSRDYKEQGNKSSNTGSTTVCYQINNNEIKSVDIDERGRMTKIYYKYEYFVTP